MMTIQHAGVVIGLGAHRTAGHTHYRIPVQILGYMGRSSAILSPV